MNKKKKAENPAAAPVEKPLVVDEEQFTDAIRSLVNSPPAPLETIRRKNPETDPRYRPVFGSHTQNQDREEEKEEALELTQPMFDSLYRRIELLIDGFDCLCA